MTKRVRLAVAVVGVAVTVSATAVTASAADHVASHRLTGNGQRNHEFLTADVRIAGATVTGVVALGLVNGSEVCTYKSFANGSVSGTTAAFDATGWCTANKPGFNHVAAHHHITVNDVAGGDDQIDVNALPDSPSEITIPGGTVLIGEYYLN